MWYALQLKDTYNRPGYYHSLMEELQTPKYGFKLNDIFVAGSSKKQNSVCNYIFLRYNADPQPLWNKLKCEKYFNSYEEMLPIPDEQLEALKKSYLETKLCQANYGDIVKINSGPCKDLWGIVLKTTPDYYEVGMNFYKAPVFFKFSPEEVHREKSLFEIWKFKKLI